MIYEEISKVSHEIVFDSLSFVAFSYLSRMSQTGLSQFGLL
jgi:hypothetical protein